LIEPKIYFTDFFEVKEKTLERYGAFNISLLTDIPLFVDPFLLFNSKKRKYQKLHKEIIKYLIFLRDVATDKGVLDQGLINAWYKFSEVKQNWLGFTSDGNRGSGLGSGFAKALHENLGNLFGDFGNETSKVAKDSHLEKLCLIKDHVGRDNISDFTTNLIKSYLLEYTEAFTKRFIHRKYKKRFRVKKAVFNYSTKSWVERTYTLPNFNNDFVILTPKDILTRDDTWINKGDLYKDFESIPTSIGDSELRSQVDYYFRSLLPKKRDPKKEERDTAIMETLRKFPQLIDYFIKFKEEQGDKATSVSGEKVRFSEHVFISNVYEFFKTVKSEELQGLEDPDSYTEAQNRINFFKHKIENGDCYRLFYSGNKPVKHEKDVQLFFKFVWMGTKFSVDAEVNNGRGPVDFKISKGANDCTLVEFKLGSNTSLKKNLKKQVEIYEKANSTEKSIKVIVYFNKAELFKIQRILKELKLLNSNSVILIDARKDNKPSGSRA